MSGASLNGDLEERPFCEAVKLKPGLPWRPQDVRDARAVGPLQGELLTGGRTRTRDRNMSQSNLNGVGDLKSVLTWK